MGGRGAKGGSGGGGAKGGSGGGNSQNKLLSIPKLTKAAIGKLGRSELETLATAIFANNSMRQGLSKQEGVRRAKSLMSGNTTAQLRRYVTKNI